MTSRERLISSMKHKMPDRVPIDFGSHRSSGISAIAYAKLKKYLGINSGDIYVYDMIQQLAIVEPEVLDALDVDVIELGRGFLRDATDWKEWVLPDGTPCKIPSYINVKKRGADWILCSDTGLELGEQRVGCLYFEQTHWPWIGRNPENQDFSDLDEAFASTIWTGVPSPGGHLPISDAGLDLLSRGAKALRSGTERGIVGLFGANLFEVPQFFYRIDNYLTYLGLYPDACRRLTEALVDYYLPRLEKWLGAVGDSIDVMLFGDDLGGQNGPLISPHMYREILKPGHKRLWSRVKELAPNVFTHLHTCGGIEPLLDDLIDAGLDSANPVQITSVGMNPAILKDRYGERFVFWGGGCDTRSMLPNGTPAEIDAHVRELMNIWTPKGGYVFQQVHNILSDVEPENIVAMFRAATGGTA